MQAGGCNVMANRSSYWASIVINMVLVVSFIIYIVCFVIGDAMPYQLPQLDVYLLKYNYNYPHLMRRNWTVQKVVECRWGEWSQYLLQKRL